ncbi:MAG: hybrid sensor histidine kinase/response regulator, partial [Herbinix sp.]|nr:hybrid sensor histidine kinase/response regulator [Herbinix sp.]
MLQNNDKLASEILSAIGHGIIATDIEGKVNYINQHAEQILETTSKDVLDKNFDQIFELYHAETKERLPDPVANVIQNNVQTGLEANSVLIIHNTIKYVSAACTPYYNRDGIMMGVVVGFRDITRLRTL